MKPYLVGEDGKPFLVVKDQPIVLTLSGYISKFLHKNKKVYVDNIRRSKSHASGYSARVVGVYKKPCYIDMGWFKEFGTKIFKRWA